MRTMTVGEQPIFPKKIIFYALNLNKRTLSDFQ